MAKTQTRTAASEPAHLTQRVKHLQKRLAEHDLDALLVTNARDVRYLTGFIGDDSWALIPRRGRTRYILSDFRFQEQVEREAPHAKLTLRRKGLAEELAQLIEPLNIEQLAMQEQYVTLALRKTIAKHVGARRLAPIDDKLLQQRAVKTDDEIALIRKALRIQEQAYVQTLEFMQPGQPEQEVAAFLEFRMRSLGADGPSFPTIIAADANASLPHAVPGKKKLRQGGSVLIDWGARYSGYCSDLTRVVALGRMSTKMREIYQIVLDAQLAAIDAIHPGVAMKDVDAVARGIIDKAGYGQQFGHSLGHGIGLDIHEQPTLAPRSEGVLEPGHVVTVEPGIYLPGVGGVRIEDDVLVTPRGRKVLSKLPKTLESAII